MKNFLTLLLLVSLVNLLSAQNSNVLFFDDFEETPNEDGSFSNWTTENIEGWHYWHIIFYGYNSNQSIRFENNDIENDDWLITKQIVGENIENVLINFYTFHTETGLKPKLLYTNKYNGNAGESDWKEIDYTLGENENEWNNSGDIIIENPGDTLYFAFHYKAAPEDAIYILIDNFKIQSYTPVQYTFIDSTEYFTFHSTIENGQEYWDEISENIDDWYVELCSYWDRPGIQQIFNTDKKTAIYLYDDDNYQNQSPNELPSWKCSYIKNTRTINTKLPVGENSIYENSYSKLVKNILGQLILTIHFGGHYEHYFNEAFGLYYSGYRPNRDSILKALDLLGQYPVISDISDTTGFSNTWKKDLTVSYIEAQALSSIGIQRMRIGQNELNWQRHFKYFYENEESKRIKLQKLTEHFSFYSTDQDINYLNAISGKLEEKLNHYTNIFEFPIQHPFNCVIYPNSEAGDYCLIVSEGYNGGSGWSGDKLDILSPVNFSGGLDEALKSLIPHEFFHVFHFNMVQHLFNIPGFHSEGMAEIMAYENENDEYLENMSWYFRDGLQRFKNENGRYPNLAEIIPDTDGYMSVYSYGQAFWHFMHQNYADYPTIKSFFNSGLDWDVFNVSYEEIDVGYINYLKSLAGITTNKNMAKRSPANNLEFINDPMSNESIISFNIQKNEKVNLSIYDIQGRKIRTLLNEKLNAGKHTVSVSNSLPAGGVYFCKLVTSKKISTKKFIVNN